MDVTATDLAMKCFVAGVTGVLLVMAFLQLSVNASSWIAQWIEGNKTKKEMARQNQ